MQPDGQKADAGEIAARSRETYDPSIGHRVTPGAEDDRYDCRRLFRRSRCLVAAAGNDQVDLAVNEFGRHCRQSIVVAFRPAILDRDVLPLNIAALAQSLAERGQDRCIEAGRPAAQIADHRHFPLLCGDCTRQQDGRAREHQEIASPHPVTSSTQPPAGISDEALVLHVALVKPGIPETLPHREQFA